MIELLCVIAFVAIGLISLMWLAIWNSGWLLFERSGRLRYCKRCGDYQKYDGYSLGWVFYPVFGQPKAKNPKCKCHKYAVKT